MHTHSVQSDKVSHVYSLVFMHSQWNALRRASDVNMNWLAEEPQRFCNITPVRQAELEGADGSSNMHAELFQDNKASSSDPKMVGCFVASFGPQEILFKGTGSNQKWHTRAHQVSHIIMPS